MAQVLELPVTFTDRAIIEGEMNSLRNTALITGTIPHLWYKKSHIEDAFISARKDSTEMALFIETNSYNKNKYERHGALEARPIETVSTLYSTGITTPNRHFMEN